MSLVFDSIQYTYICTEIRNCKAWPSSKHVSLCKTFEAIFALGVKIALGRVGHQNVCVYIKELTVLQYLFCIVIRAGWPAFISSTSLRMCSIGRGTRAQAREELVAIRDLIDKCLRK